MEMTKKDQFLHDYDNAIYARWLVVAIELDNEEIELITNSGNSIFTKMDYYRTEYDDDLKLIRNPDVRIVNWMFA